ncbi:MAG TPA: glycosyltransferase family 4 protein [Verrucomicrobiae bacterium]|nr:glycosyltransferase family 4 protein [Verrucomicrobiae bacterium]
MTEPLRVLALPESNQVTGPAKNLLQFARLARPRVVLEVAVFWRPNNPSGFTDAAAAAGVTVHRIPENGRFDRRVIASLREVLKSARPHILQTHAMKGHFLARFGKLHLQYPWIAFHHGYTCTDWLNRVYNQLDRWSLAAARRVVTMNGQFQRDLQRRGVSRERIAVIHNAIDPSFAAEARGSERVSALRAELGLGSDEKVLLMAARLSKEKDHATLLRALAILRDRHGIKPKLVVLGDGAERPYIEEDVLRLRLGEQVILPGWRPSEPYYGIADIAVLSSVTEGSPNAVLEALGARVPLVATAVGGIPEIVRDGESALLVPAGAAERMAEALKSMLANPDLAAKLAARGHEIAQEQHSPGARVRALCALYEEVLR